MARGAAAGMVAEPPARRHRDVSRTRRGGVAASGRIWGGSCQDSADVCHEVITLMKLGFFSYVPACVTSKRISFVK